MQKRGRCFIFSAKFSFTHAAHPVGKKPLIIN
jgi:hypothetical protein